MGGLLLTTPASAAPKVDPDVVASSDTYKKDSLKLDGAGELSGLTEMNQPWYVKKLDSKKTVFVWGPGAAKSGTPSKRTSRATAAAAATCSLLVDKVYYSSDRLRSNTLTTCSAPGGISTEGLFQRRNLALIWVSYGGTSRTGTVVGTTFDQAWSQVCNDGDGKGWLYRFRARSYTSVAGTSAWYNGSSSTYYCGT